VRAAGFSSEGAARRALGAGLVRLAARPGATAAAVVAGALSALALGAGQAAARAVVDRAGLGGGGGRAALLFFLGGTVSALSFYAGLGAVLGGGRLRGAVRRGTFVISLTAIERLLQFCLVLGAAMVFGRWTLAHPEASTLARAAALTAAVLPTLPLWLIAVPAFNLAAARAAAGEPGYRALPIGLSLCLSHLGVVLRTGGLALLATGLLWLPPLALGGRIVAAQHPLVAVLAAALGGALAMLAALWGYATLLSLSEDLGGADAGHG